MNGDIETTKIKEKYDTMWILKQFQKYLQGIPIRWNFTFHAAKLDIEYWLLISVWCQFSSVCFSLFGLFFFPKLDTLHILQNMNFSIALRSNDKDYVAEWDNTLSPNDFVVIFKKHWTLRCIQILINSISKWHWSQCHIEIFDRFCYK